jgi:imidazole glycerol-phosphate synthase subunit HisF
MANMFYGATLQIFKGAEELRKSQTEDGKLLWIYLKSNQLGVRFKRQHPIWMYIADFIAMNLSWLLNWTVRFIGSQMLWKMTKSAKKT